MKELAGAFAWTTEGECESLQTLRSSLFCVTVSSRAKVHKMMIRTVSVSSMSQLYVHTNIRMSAGKLFFSSCDPTPKSGSSVEAISSILPCVVVGVASNDQGPRLSRDLFRI